MELKEFSGQKPVRKEERVGDPVWETIGALIYITLVVIVIWFVVAKMTNKEKDDIDGNEK